MVLSSSAPSPFNSLKRVTRRRAGPFLPPPPHRSVSRYVHVFLSTALCPSKRAACAYGGSFLTPRGLEPENVTDCNSSKLQNPQKSGGAESGAQSAENGSNRPALFKALASALRRLSQEDQAKLSEMLSDDASADAEGNQG